VNCCNDCQHFAPRDSECRKLLGVYYCSKCQKKTDPGVVRCRICLDLVDPSPIWEISEPASPPSYCPGFIAREPDPPPAMAEADDIEPTKTRKRRTRKPKPQQRGLFD